MNVHKENLTAALRLAIQGRRDVEKTLGYTGDSGFVAGLDEVLRHIEAGGQIRIIDSDHTAAPLSRRERLRQ